MKHGRVLRIELNHEGVESLLRDPDITAQIFDVAKEVAREANSNAGSSSIIKAVKGASRLKAKTKKLRVGGGSKMSAQVLQKSLERNLRNSMSEAYSPDFIAFQNSEGHRPGASVYSLTLRGYMNRGELLKALGKKYGK